MTENKENFRLVKKNGRLNINVFELDNEKNQTYKTLYQKEYYHAKIKDITRERKMNEFVTCKCGVTHNKTMESKKEHTRSKEHKYFLRNKKPITEKKYKPKPDRSVPMVCECGVYVQKWNIFKHLKTKKHNQRLEDLKEIKNI